MKQVMLINSLVSYSRVGIHAQTSIFQQEQIGVVALPSALYSTNLAYPNARVLETGNFLGESLKHFHELNLQFDGICVGMVKNPKTIEVLEKYLHETKIACKVLDPVFADHKRLYKGFCMKDVEQLKAFIPEFDVMLPNMSEAIFLSGTCPTTLLEWCDVAKKMRMAYQIDVVITGIALETDHDYLYVIASSHEKETIKRMKRLQDYSGAGDVFSAMITAKLMNGFVLEDALADSLKWIEKLFLKSMLHKQEETAGLLFENYIENG